MKTVEVVAGPRPQSERVVAAAAVVAVAAFLPTLASFHVIWSSIPYTHGYLIAGASLWLLFRDRAAFRTDDAGGRLALGVAVALSLVWLAATVASVLVFRQILVPALFLVWCAATFGRQTAKRLAPIAAIFMLAVPFWGVASRPLQTMTVMASGSVAALLGVPADIQGDMIHIPSGTFLVEAGCSGLSFLLSGLAVSGIYALAFLTRWTTRVALVASASAIAIIGNWIRVASLIVIGHSTSMESGLMESHLWFGWAIFLGGLIALVPVTRWLEEKDRAEPVDADRPPVPSPGIASIPDPVAPRAWGPHGRASVLATAAIAAGPVLFATIDALPSREPNSEPFALGDRGEWHLRADSGNRPYSMWTPAFTGETNRRAHTWTDGSRTILVDVLEYRDQRQGAELIGYPNAIAADSILLGQRPVLRGATQRRRVITEAVVRDGDHNILVAYWYRVGGIETASPVRAKLFEITAFLRRREGAELVAVSTVCAPTACTDASEAIAGFLGG